MELQIKNIYNFDNYRLNKLSEFFETLYKNKLIKIERIISEGHTSPPDFWYDQDEYEWVVLLKGMARIRFKDKPESITLTEGDCLLIKPHEFHRVEWTDPNQKTIWLAIHFNIAAPIAP